MKRPPQRILCATDLGPGGDRAIIEADAWAKRHGASLEFVYAVPEASRTHALFPQITRRTMSGFPAFARSATDAISERVGQLTNRSDVNVEVEIGSPVSIIVNIAEEMEADLVVIGAGDEDEANGRLGSIARRVIQHSPCPVLLAPPSRYSTKRPAPSWSSAFAPAGLSPEPVQDPTRNGAARSKPSPGQDGLL